MSMMDAEMGAILVLRFAAFNSNSASIHLCGKSVGWA
jgi:hypothetical protein